MTFTNLYCWNCGTDDLGKQRFSCIKKIFVANSKLFFKKIGLFGVSKNAGVSRLKYWIDKSTQLNQGSYIQSNDAPPRPIPRQVGNGAIKLMRLIIQGICVQQAFSQQEFFAKNKNGICMFSDKLISLVKIQPLGYVEIIFLT